MAHTTREVLNLFNQLSTLLLLLLPRLVAWSIEPSQLGIMLRPFDVRGSSLTAPCRANAPPRRPRRGVTRNFGRKKKAKKERLP
uniref:Putative secreted protein n=1 Tax=Anopheles marajoara TaxID=58244 RepID=A0A2M4CB25_9DIPT